MTSLQISKAPAAAERALVGTPTPASAAPSATGAPCRFAALLGERVLPAAPVTTAFPSGPLSPTRATDAASPSLRGTLEQLLDGDRRVDGALTRLLGKGTMSPRALLAVQADVMRHAQTVDLASRLVDRLSGAVKQTLMTQV